jgi:hypothetical protein
VNTEGIVVNPGPSCKDLNLSFLALQSSDLIKS